jgi:uncharacterized membrane protein
LSGRLATRRRLRLLTVALHLGLMLALAAVLLRSGAPPPVAALVTAAAVLPLLAALPGLIADRAATLPWLALALVAYVGLATVEAIASVTPSAAAMLLLALLELGLVLLLSRTPRPR